MRFLLKFDFMKIFILNPKVEGSERDLIFSPRRRQPLSLAYLASLLKGDYQIKLLDANALDLKAEQVLTEIEKFQPDALILTSAADDRWECPHPKIDSVFKIINQARITNTILIGPHGSLTPDWVFQKCEVKFIIRGEPELTVKKLIDILAGGLFWQDLAGISYREGSKVFHNVDASRIENLDELPLPVYEMLPMEKYNYSFSDLPQPFSIMVTSRGCPFQCSYCLKVMSAGKYIARNPRSVVAEMKYLKERFSIRSIFFQDWEFMIDKERVRQICQLILENNLKIIWGCNGRANDIDENLVRIMKEAGCVRINIGFESGSQKILNQAQKKIKISDLEKAIKICRDNQIKIGMYALLNLPGENRFTLKETVKFLTRNKISSMNFNLPIPYFGTPLFSLIKNFSSVDWNNLENFAGRVEVGFNPFWARFLLRHYIFQSKLGYFYFLGPAFYKEIFKKIKRLL
jgi:radical SAM superfamily enzyme YgiQ (UPF0313 family)